MPNTCAAYGCNFRFGAETKAKGITFHLLPPATDIRRKLWIANSRRIDPMTRKPWDPPSKYVYFCSEHFMPSDFEPSGKPNGRRLRDTAVPTVFTFPTVLPPNAPDAVKVSSTGTDGQPAGAVKDAAPTAENTTSQTKQSARMKKPKHRKVVMLPKKIKHLQENSQANMESVTIISFQHLDYDEKLQPMIQEAILDLQYPEESEGEEDDEFYDDEYTEPQAEYTFAEMEDGLINNNQAQDDEPIEILEEIDHNTSPPLKKRKYLESSVGEPDGGLRNNNSSISETNSSVPEEIKLDFEVDVCSEAEVPAERNIHSEPLTANKSESRTILKKRVPMVFEELSAIQDMEELRRKAVRIAEDNVKLKRQVMYLERKLEHLIS